MRVDVLGYSYIVFRLSTADGALSVEVEVTAVNAAVRHEVLGVLKAHGADLFVSVSHNISRQGVNVYCGGQRPAVGGADALGYGSLVLVTGPVIPSPVLVVGIPTGQTRVLDGVELYDVVLVDPVDAGYLGDVSGLTHATGLTTRAGVVSGVTGESGGLGGVDLAVGVLPLNVGNTETVVVLVARGAVAVLQAVTDQEGVAARVVSVLVALSGGVGVVPPQLGLNYAGGGGGTSLRANNEHGGAPSCPLKGCAARNIAHDVYLRQIRVGDSFEANYL